ncbi:MAG: DUF2115 domain-containing protein [Euryarchaeota archaeon]|nr:DUF2115 domain-containing protein [Euryarchaeota archaeon]
MKLLDRLPSWRNRKADTGEQDALLYIISDAEADAGNQENGDQTQALYIDEVSRIRDACTRFAQCTEKQTALFLLGEELSVYPLNTLEQLMASFERKAQALPAHYRDKLLPKIHEEICGAYHDLMAAWREGEEIPGTLSPSWLKYWNMVFQTCKTRALTKNPRNLFCKYLITGGTMYVFERPGHPVGTPFPGGQIVDSWDGVVYCPVRDMADDVESALCPFCPAVQSDDPIYPQTKQIRLLQERQKNLNNYWTNYKG